MSRPNVPLIVLTRGAHRVELYDPRPHPERLGARFVQGGWVSSWRVDGRELTGRCDADWLSFDGIGLPETFESGLGWPMVDIGDEFMRVGAGRIRKTKDPNEISAMCELTTLLDWEVDVHGAEAVFRTRDALKTRKIEYTLERRIRLEDDGVVSTTTFAMQSWRQNWQWLSWYAHPFFPQRSHNGNAVLLPAAATPVADWDGWRGRVRPEGAQRGDDGRWRLCHAHGRQAFGGLWGAVADPLAVHLDGGGQVAIACDRPLDHLVLWGTDQVMSVEPKWARTWLHEESATWSMRYRFTA